MANSKPIELTISPDHFIFRIAWYEWQGMKNEANALRELAEFLQPSYRRNKAWLVDEALVQERVRYLRKYDEQSTTCTGTVSPVEQRTMDVENLLDNWTALTEMGYSLEVQRRPAYRGMVHYNVLVSDSGTRRRFVEHWNLRSTAQLAKALRRTLGEAKKVNPNAKADTFINE